MTAFSELKQRARSKAHDISDPASDVSISSTLTGKDVAERAMSRVTVVHRTIANSGGGAATDAIAERAVLTAPASLYPNGVKLVEIGFRTDTAVVQDANDYASDAFDIYSAAGVSVKAGAATLTTRPIANGGIGTTVAQARYVATMAAAVADVTIPPGGCLSFERTKVNSGISMPDCLYDITFEAL